MITSYYYGNLIFYSKNKKEWLYIDGVPINKIRPCPKCGEYPTTEGYDACLGHIPNTKSACCGHGMGKNFIIKT